MLRRLGPTALLVSIKLEQLGIFTGEKGSMLRTYKNNVAYDVCLKLKINKEWLFFGAYDLLQLCSFC